MRIEHIEPHETAKLDQWDAFNMHSPRGHYCQLSTWLRSFAVYGFQFHVIVAKNSDDCIVGGMGLLSFKALSSLLVSSPIGPLVEIGSEHASYSLLEAALDYAKSHKAFLLQLQFPAAAGDQLPATMPPQLPQTPRPQTGQVWRTGNAPNLMQWLDFNCLSDLRDDAWSAAMLKSFKENTRRNIRTSLKNGLSASEARTESELREACRLIESNGQEQGYATRTWEEIGPTLMAQVEKNQAIVTVAHHEDKMLGVHYGVIAGRRYSYIMGGTQRVQPDLRIGHFLHWTAISKAKELGLLGYDLTSGGSEGVSKFKAGFNPQRVEFVAPQHYVLSRPKYSAFMKMYPVMRRHKKLMSRILRVIKEKEA